MIMHISHIGSLLFSRFAAMQGIYNRCQLKKGAFANGKCWVSLAIYWKVAFVGGIHLMRFGVIFEAGRFQMHARDPARSSSSCKLEPASNVKVITIPRQA